MIGQAAALLVAGGVERLWDCAPAQFGRVPVYTLPCLRRGGGGGGGEGARELRSTHARTQIAGGELGLDGVSSPPRRLLCFGRQHKFPPTRWGGRIAGTLVWF